VPPNNNIAETLEGHPWPLGARSGGAGPTNTYAQPLTRNRPSSPSHSISSATSQATNYNAQDIRRISELLQEQSEILKQREALVIEQRAFLDRIDAIRLEDDPDDHPPAVPTLFSRNDRSTQQIPPTLNLGCVATPRERASNVCHPPLESGFLPGLLNRQPPLSNPSATVMQALLNKIESLEQQLQARPTANRGWLPQQTAGMPNHQSPLAPITSTAYGVSPHRRLTSDQLASRKCLPRELPKYNGKPAEWPLFYATYNQTTEICGFSDEENLIRLRQALEGPARNAVKNLLLHSSCVPQIISTVQMRFGRPELIISVLQQQICELQTPSESQLETIVDFAIAVQNICATIKASGLASHLSNPELEQKLVSKLPGLLPMYWGVHKQGLSNCNLQTFSDWLFHLAQGANCVLVPTEQTKVRKRGAVNHHHKTVSCIVCKENCSALSNCDSFKEMSRSQKWDTVRQLKLCHRCLKKHLWSDCKSKGTCNVNGCTRYHHPLLHNEPSVATNEQTCKANKKTQMANINAHNVGEEGPLFRVLPVVLHAGANIVSTYAFIDDGSSLTLIDEELLHQLNVKGTPQPLCLRWTGDTHRYEDDSVTVDLAISSKQGTEKFPMKAVRSVKKLDLPTQSLDAAKLQSKFKYLRGLPLQSYGNVKPQLLIGLNNAALGSAIKSRLGDDSAPIAEKTKLGWTVKGHGSIALQGATQYVYHICDCSEHKELLQAVKSHICLDNLGVVANAAALMSKDDELAVEQLEQHTVRVGDRFQTSLLWKHPNMQLPDSLPMAQYRARCLLKKMQRDPKLSEQLQVKIADYLRKGYARRMTSEDAAADRYWYLPVFAVSNANKPGKVRLVWDAAATVNGVSLNSMLFAGPDLTTPLLSVLFKFRQKRVGITADIEEMFHQ
ncbi:uncharacterized protein LOC118757236, partial [Rhagoletis pomonella]|uniref:uncharacterized protein LOC118757236 n=1 Tax=Rhagoletis pomonella TaxID=28610 RepID=UPI001782CDAF